MKGWIRINKNSSKMHRALRCTCSRRKISTFLFPSLWICLQPDHWCCWWHLLQYLSLHDIGCSVCFILLIHKVLLIMHPPSVFSLFIFLVHNSFPSCYLPPAPQRKSEYWIISCCQILLPSFTSHIMLMVGHLMWLIVQSIFLHFLFPLSLSWFIVGV